MSKELVCNEDGDEYEWQSADGKSTPISQMTDSHVHNALSWIGRQKPDGYPQFRGEMAQYYAEQDYQDTMDHIHEWQGILKQELDRRGLT